MSAAPEAVSRHSARARDAIGPNADAALPPLASVSVVIPTLNEASSLPETVASARTPDVEILVVDGGSSDDTVGVAQALGVRIVHSEQGRGSQLAAGAEAARGELLVFLHADARLPADYVTEVRRTLSDASTAVGAFRLRIDSPGPLFRIVEWGVRHRCRWLGMPYGDQALFMRADLYRRLGGFRALPAMEDLDLVRRARCLGSVRTLRRRVTVSPRSWERHGVVRLTLLNALSAAACAMGVDPGNVARWRGRLLAALGSSKRP